MSTTANTDDDDDDNNNVFLDENVKLKKSFSPKEIIYYALFYTLYNTTTIHYIKIRTI